MIFSFGLLGLTVFKHMKFLVQDDSVISAVVAMLEDMPEWSVRPPRPSVPRIPDFCVPKINK